VPFINTRVELKIDENEIYSGNRDEERASVSTMQNRLSRSTEFSQTSNGKGK